jgi:prepilin signal peptidase PulO-like enzyme (type II secretory pathway)
MMLCLIMYGYVGGKVLHMGNGDRKIIFGLTLQLGWMFGLIILGFIFGVGILKRLQDDKRPVPLVPVILIAYIVMVLYKIGVENFA